MPSSLPVFALLFNALVWGLSWIPFQALRAAGLHAAWSTALIYGAILIGMTLWRPAVWKDLLAHPALWLLALTSGATNVAFNWAASTGDVVRVILLFYLMPAWAVLLAWKFLGERPSAAGLLRLALAFFGMALVIVPPGASWESLTADISQADLLALFGGFCFAMTNVALRKTHAAPASARMTAMFVGCSLLGLSVALLGMLADRIASPPTPHWSWLIWALGMAALVTVGNWAFQYGAGKMPISTTSLIMLSEVLFATLSAWLLGATDLTPRMLIGGGCIIACALLATLQLRRPAVA